MNRGNAEKNLGSPLPDCDDKFYYFGLWQNVHYWFIIIIF